MKRIVFLLVALTFVAPALHAQSFYGVLSIRSAFGFSLEVLLGGGLSFFNDRVNMQIEGGYFFSAAGPHGAVFPMTGALIYFEPTHFKGSSGLQIGGGIRTMTRDSLHLAPTVGIRYRGEPKANGSNTYGELETMLALRRSGSILPRVGFGVRRMIPY